MRDSTTARALRIGAQGELNDEPIQTVERSAASLDETFQLIEDVMELGRAEAGRLELEFDGSTLAR